MTAGRRAAARAPDDLRLTPRTDPVRLLLSASLWRAAGYLLSYLLASVVLFGITLTVAVTAAVLACTVAAVPLLLGAAWVIRGCASFERLRLRLICREPISGAYPPQPGPGLWRRAKAAWTQGATWRDLGYLAGLWAPLFALDAIVCTLWAVLLAGAALPLWYQHARDVCIGSCATQDTAGVMIGHYPHGPHGPGAHGVYVQSVSTALLIAAVAAVLFLLFNYVLIAVASLHGRVARAILRTPADPLAAARSVLTAPGPLGPLRRVDP